MKVYWTDREGKSPPPSVLFSWCPFTSDAPCTFSASRVDQLPPPTQPIQVLKRTLSPAYPLWKSHLLSCLEMMEKEQLQKIVLARSCELELAEPPDPFALTAALKQKAKGAFVFCFQWEDKAFLGASPERLFARNGRVLETEAVAGTCARDPHGPTDLLRQQHLLQSDKERREISFVIDYLQETLAPFCQEPFTFSPLQIHSTHHLHHLYSQAKGLLLPTVTDEEILAHIHPTPALCGVPKKKALSLIQSLEPFKRNLYGGALGWKTEQASEWIVGIRSCFLEGNRATLYTGTGIVKGSSPQLEWEELNTKLRLYQSIFTDI